MRDLEGEDVAAKRIAIVSPCLNEEAGLRQFLDRLRAVLSSIPDVNFTVILIDDGSQDQTWKIISLEAKAHEIPLVGVRLTRNFGHQNAIWTGIGLARGFDAVLTLDSDLQDPPEAIAPMIDRWKAGFAVVTGVRASRPQSDGRLKTLLSRSFYRFLGVLDREVGESLSRDSGDFRLLDSSVVRVLLELRVPKLYIRGMVPSLGFPEAEVLYERERRQAGSTKFSLRKMANFASDALYPFALLMFNRVTTALGILGALLFLATGTYILVSLGSSQIVAGWSSTVLLVSLFGSINLIGISILGRALANLEESFSMKPKAVVQELLNRTRLEP